VRIPFLKEEHADYAAKALNVDEELQVGKAFRECRAEGKDLIVLV
jgi:Transcription factor Pcc1